MVLDGHANGDVAAASPHDTDAPAGSDHRSGHRRRPWRQRRQSRTTLLTLAHRLFAMLLNDLVREANASRHEIHEILRNRPYSLFRGFEVYASLILNDQHRISLANAQGATDPCRLRPDLSILER